jgi:hypothetical protein
VPISPFRGERSQDFLGWAQVGVEQRRPHFLAGDVDLLVDVAVVAAAVLEEVAGRTEAREWCVGFMRCPRTSPH